jgi:putative phosphoesterase
MYFSEDDKIGLIGDVHAEDESLAAALDFFQAHDVTRVLCVGDIVDGPGDINRTCELLRRHPVTCVRGNHDRWCLAREARSLPMAHDPDVLTAKNKAFLAGLPATIWFDSPIGGILLCHALGDNDMIKVKSDISPYDIEHTIELQELFADPDIDFMIGGHTHVAMVKKFDRLTMINPGTLYRVHSPGIAILDLARASVDFWKIIRTPSQRGATGINISSSESISLLR